MNQLIKLGKFGKPHGVDGTLRFFGLGSGDSIEPGASLYIKLDISNEFKKYEVQNVKGKNKSLIKLKEFSSPECARILVNKEVYLERSSLKQLKESEYYLADLIGGEVFDFDDCYLGLVEKYYNNGSHEVCCLDTKLEFPLIKKFIKEIKMKEKVMKLTLTREFFNEFS